MEFVGELPRTESGKVQKFKLRERGRSAETWDREAAGIKLRASKFGFGAAHVQLG